MADKHGAHQTDEAYVVSLCEDYCKSPSSPVGYMISQKLGMSSMVCSSVNGCGTSVLNISSRITSVTGNEAGIAGGVVSGVNVGMCKPVQNYAPKVRAEGQCVLRHDTIMEMNCAGPEGQGNVLGKIAYLEKSFDDSKSNQPKPQPLPAPAPKKIGEYTTENGSKVPIYEDPSMGGNGRYKWDSANGPRIIVGPNSDKYTLANEQAHAESDSRGPGGFDGIGHKKNGDVMTPLENEADSDAASIEEAEKDLKALGGCDSFCEQLVTAGCYFLPARKFQYEQRLSLIHI